MVKATTSQYPEQFPYVQRETRKSSPHRLHAARDGTERSKSSSEAKRNSSPSNGSKIQRAKTKRNDFPSKVKPAPGGDRKFASPPRPEDSESTRQLRTLHASPRYQQRDRPPAAKRETDREVRALRVARIKRKVRELHMGGGHTGTTTTVVTPAKNQKKPVKERKKTAPRERRSLTSTKERSQTAPPKGGTRRSQKATTAEKTGLQVSLERLEATRAFYDDFYADTAKSDTASASSESGSVTTTESAIVNNLNAAKERYQQMLAERRATTKIYSEGEEGTAQSESSSGVDANLLVSLHPEDRCNTPEVLATTKKAQKKQRPKKKGKSSKPSKEKVRSIFRKERSKSKRHKEKAQQEWLQSKSESNTSMSSKLTEEQSVSSRDLQDEAERLVTTTATVKTPPKNDKPLQCDEVVESVEESASFMEEENETESSKDVADLVKEKEIGKEPALVIYIKEKEQSEKNRTEKSYETETKVEDEVEPTNAKEEPEDEYKDAEIKKKRDEYEAKMNSLMKYLKKPTPETYSLTMPKKIPAEEVLLDSQVAAAAANEAKTKSNQEDQAVQHLEITVADSDINSDISDEGRVFTTSSVESCGEDRNEAPTEISSGVQKSPTSAEREQAEQAEIPLIDCTNFCFWFLGNDEVVEKKVEAEEIKEEAEEEPMPKEKEEEEPPEEEETPMPEENEKDKERPVLKEELVADLARRMAKDSMLLTTTKTKELGSDNDCLYSSLKTSAFLLQEERMENSARRSIATEVLTEKLLNGYTTVSTDQDNEPCSKCGMPILLGESGLECVVCPVLETDLEEVKKGMQLQDPHHQAKFAMEAEMKSLRDEAKKKARAAEKARAVESALLEKKQAAENKLDAAEEAATDAEIEILWRTKEVRKIRTTAKEVSGKARNSLEAVLQDKAKAKREAKESIVAAENACFEADRLHLSAIKEEALAELKVFIADEAVRTAIEERDQAIAEFKDIKRCRAQLKSDYDAKQVEKAWTIARTSMLLSKKETDIKARQAAREEAELKAVAISNVVVNEKEEAERSGEVAREMLAEAEATVSAIEDTLQDAQKKRMALENEADKASALAYAKATEVKKAVTELDRQISSERSKLEIALGSFRANAIEDATWDAQAKQIYETRTNAPRKLSMVREEEEIVKQGDEPVLAQTEPESQGLGNEDEGTLATADVTLLDEGDAEDDDSLRSLIVKDSWNFYREICGLVSCRWKYDEAFRKVQLDPLYPYLNTCPEMNRQGNIWQKEDSGYQNMTMSEIGRDLTEKAKMARPLLIEICKDVAKKLKTSPIGVEIGVGPIKEVNAAIEKAEKKYDGNLLRVTDFCRAFMVVSDVATLLALFEILAASMPHLIHRIKFSALKKDHDALPGGYRDCKINLLINDHICELQIHILPMWSVGKLQGYAHYQKSREYSIEKTKDPYTALNGLDEKTLSKLVQIGEESTADTPIESLKFGDEGHILDFIASAGIYMQLNEAAKAEEILLKLTTLRSKTPGIGPLHNETLFLKKRLESALRDQDMDEEADMIAEQLAEAERRFKDEAEDASASLWEFLYFDASKALDRIIDPSEREGENDDKVEEEASAAKKQWIKRREKSEDLKKCKVADVALTILNL